MEVCMDVIDSSWGSMPAYAFQVLLTQFESLPPLHANTPSAQQERLLGRKLE